MNGFPLNSGALNGGSNLASIVYLPSATATVELSLSERIAVSLSGGLDMSISPSGDISKVSNLGSAPVTIAILAEGSLSQARMVHFDYSTTGFDFEPTGTLSKMVIGPSGECTWGMDATGDMTRIGVMSGIINKSLDISSTGFFAVRSFGSQEVTLSLDPTASLTRIRYMGGSVESSITPYGSITVGLRRNLGTADTGFAITPSGSIRLTGGLVGTSTVSINPTGFLSQGIKVAIPASTAYMACTPEGNLSQVFRLSGSIETGLELSGSLSGFTYMSGSIEIARYLQGNLASNPQGMDLAPFLMTRRERKREMTR